MRNKGLLAVFITVTLGSCSAAYQVVKSNRAAYAVNTGLAADTALVNVYLPYKKQLDAEMNQVIGHSAVALLKNNDLPETQLGNFFADACLEQAKKLDPAIDFAMPSTKGGLRTDIPKGEIKLSNLFELMPFENELISFTLKGTDMQELLNFIAATNGQPVSGLKMQIRDKKPASVVIQGKAFDPSKTYRVLTSDYIAGGGDNALGFKAPLDKKVLGLKVRDALIAEVKAQQAAGKIINAELDGRITKD